MIVAYFNKNQGIGLNKPKTLERVTRVELVFTDWQPVVIAIIRYPRDGARGLIDEDLDESA